MQWDQLGVKDAWKGGGGRLRRELSEAELSTQSKKKPLPSPRRRQAIQQNHRAVTWPRIYLEVEIKDTVVVEFGLANIVENEEISANNIK